MNAQPRRHVLSALVVHVHAKRDRRSHTHDACTLIFPGLAWLPNFHCLRRNIIDSVFFLQCVLPFVCKYSVVVSTVV